MEIYLKLHPKPQFNMLEPFIRWLHDRLDEVLSRGPGLFLAILHPIVVNILCRLEHLCPGLLVSHDLGPSSGRGSIVQSLLYDFLTIQTHPFVIHHSIF